MRHLSLTPAWSNKVIKGYPWVYKHAILQPPELAPGELVYLTNKKNRPIAIGYYNCLTHLACRILSHNPQESIDEAFFLRKLSAALKRREQLIKKPFYRLVHAEGDYLPGLIIDRFGDTLVCQTNTAGMERLKPLWLNVLRDLLPVQRILCRDDVPLRQKEGLPLAVSAFLGDLTAPIVIEENDTTFFASPSTGQKTGWFYDHRANRRWVAQQAKNKTLLDLYTFAGGFGVCAAVHGAKAVTLIDSSANALSLGQQAAEANGVNNRCSFVQAEIFTWLTQVQSAPPHYDIVVADPPAFVKEARHKGAGLRGYFKLARLASPLVKPGGLLFIASCSHHASPVEFRQAVEKGIAASGRQAKLVYKAGADKDHPIHPFLPENHYLKALTFQLT